MLNIRKGFGDEKTQLQELNSRLDQYLSRVRQLEEENQLLVEEIRKLHLERGAEWAQGYHSELTELRGRVEELTVQKGEAEIQRENLYQELQSLQELWDQVRSMRLRIDQQLSQYKQDLEQARKNQAALEELYCRLLQECHVLRGSHQEELVALTEQSVVTPLRIAMHEIARPSLTMQEVQSFSLELSESWKEVFLLYQRKIEELECSLRLSEKSRQETEEEVRANSALVVELRKEYEELIGIRKVLEEELLIMKDKYSREIEEYQIIIEALEHERQTVTINITERLRDYQELMQVKTGLSLEVAAYRALLEAESSKGNITWTNQTTKKRPAGYMTAFDRTKQYIKREEHKKEFPAIRTNKELQRTIQHSNVHTFPLQTTSQMQMNPQAMDKGRMGHFFAVSVQEATAREKSNRWNSNVQPRYEFLRSKDGSSNAFYQDYSARSQPSSYSVTEKIKQEPIHYLKSNNSTKQQLHEISNLTFDRKEKGTQSQTRLVSESKLGDEMKISTKVVKDDKLGFKSTAINIPIVSKVGSSVTESVENKNNKEHLRHELPVKHERKTKEQVKKEKDEFKREDSEGKHITGEDKMETSESVEVYILREKQINDQTAVTIPIQSEVSTKEENLSKNSMEKSSESDNLYQTQVSINANKPGERIAEHLEKSSMVAGILRHFGQPLDSDNVNVTYVEKKEQSVDGSLKTEIFVETKTKEDVGVFDEPDVPNLWNSNSYQRIQANITRTARNTEEDIPNKKETTREGKGVEDWIGNIIQNELKGRSGVSVNVEIVEESTGTFGSDKTEFSTPFHVEEVEDKIQATEGSCVYDTTQESVKSEEAHIKMQAPSHVEEVTEGEETDEETKYFVSIPDESPLLPDDEEETLRGQIHIEEESHMKYSWQDEYLQGSQGQTMLSKLLKCSETAESDTTGCDVMDKNSVKGFEMQELETETPNSETNVIEREIQVPHEFQSSIMGLLSKDIKDPQKQLKGTLECLQGSLPQDIVKELSTLTGEQQGKVNNLAVDIKKIDQPKESGMVTIVAEINLSQTIDAETLDPQRLLEEGVNEKDIANLLECTKANTTKSSTHFSEKQLPHEQVSAGINRVIKHIQLETSDHISQSEYSTDTEKDTNEDLFPAGANRSVHHIQLGPREICSTQQIIFEGPITETLKLDIFKSPEKQSSDEKIPIRHIKLDPTENYSTEQIVFEGPIFKTMNISSATDEHNIKEMNRDSVDQTDDQNNTLDFGDSKNISEESMNQNVYQSVEGGMKTVMHYTLNSGGTQMTKEIKLESSLPKAKLFHETDNLEENTSPTEHNFDSQKIHVAKQIKYQGLVSDPYQLADAGYLDLDQQSNVNTLVHHIKISPNKEYTTSEAAMSKKMYITDEGGSSLMEESKRSTAHIHLGAKEQAAAETYEICDVQVSSPSEDPNENESSIKHIKLGPKGKSFTFQMDITKIAPKCQGDNQE
ncbi:hypothetical protein GDO86_006453, partial [Hymenochirus boettgeri]